MEPQAALKRKKKKETILVVEDDNTSRKLLTHMLEKEGYHVTNCAEGRDAIHMAQMSHPMVMIIDVMLPDMEGTEIVEELLNFPQCEATKCIFLTGILKGRGPGKKFRFEIEDKQYRALAKPILKSQLMKVVKEALEEYEADQEKKRLEAIEKEEKAQQLKERRRALEEAKKQEATEDEDTWYMETKDSADVI